MQKSVKNKNIVFKYLFLIIVILMVAYSFSLSAEKPLKDQCERCHLETGWKELRNPVNFDHDSTDFRLRGVHSSIPCVDCHRGINWDEVHNFRMVPTECWACHHDVHSNELGDDCSRCHGFSTWSLSQEGKIHEHALFPLIGKHRSLTCESCHGPAGSMNFMQISDECVSCHVADLSRALNDDNHPRSTECEVCHYPTTWAKTGSYVHPAFPIRSGHHGGVECLECHTTPDYSDYSCSITCHFSGCSNYYNAAGSHRNAPCPEPAQHECFDCHPRG